MPYGRPNGNPVMAALRERVRCPQPQIANADDGFTDLAPADPSRAEAVKAAWAPLVPGQAVPMIGERGYAEPSDDH